MIFISDGSIIQFELKEENLALGHEENNQDWNCDM
jgi:hypothetical protein